MVSAEEREQCMRCKGRLWCGRKFCPILKKLEFKSTFPKELLKKELSGNSPPSLFAGWHNYPKISVSPLSTPSVVVDPDLFDNPSRWRDLSVDSIVDFRSSLFRSTFDADVTEARDPGKWLSLTQELSMSEKPVDVEVSLEKKPVLKIDFGFETMPMGPSAPLKDFSLAQNPLIPRKVDYLTGDTNAKSIDAIMELYMGGVSVDRINKILTAGLLGEGRKRKLVPTRWSITAVDSNVSKELVSKVKDLSEAGEFEVYCGDLMDNHYVVIFIPMPWAFEQLEAWLPGSSWGGQGDSGSGAGAVGLVEESKEEPVIMGDFEPNKGRKNYPFNVAGGYFAGRLAVCEKMLEKKHQSAALILREIHSGYWAPLGVWQVREGLRKALESKPVAFSSIEEALSFASAKLKIPIKTWKKESELVKLFGSRNLLFKYLK
ncbi:MAG: hypothetical protein J7K00_05450 [Candidatus Diapherotrites archaeon]|nr:hypothetical protein [Candidatus Diapherotrites archaeon]